MNREELDAWFAQADDVLTDWHGGTDAMHARVPTNEGDLPSRADSYYEQIEPDRWHLGGIRVADFVRFAESCRLANDGGSGVVSYRESEPLFTVDPSVTIAVSAAVAMTALNSVQAGELLIVSVQ